MKFVKMHGIGNDYVYIDAVSRPALERRFRGAAGARLVRAMSRRHTGVGSDGVILLCPPSPDAKRAGAHVRMLMFNADASIGEMCGNGVRCVAKFAHDRLRIRATPMRVETGRGILDIKYTTKAGKLVAATVNMGEPILQPSLVPTSIRTAGNSDDPVVDWLVESPETWLNLDWGWRAAGVEPRLTCVSMGNPHVVIFCDDPDRVPLHLVGPRIENHPAFPRRINVHFVRAASTGKVVMRTWERGAGETQACGTGACAVLVAGVLTNRLRRRATIHLPGGPLTIAWDKKSNHVFMTGPAADVFEGEWPDR